MRNKNCLTTAALTAILSITPLPAAEQLRFEEASVKRADRCSLQNSVDPGRIALNGDPLNLVLKEAFKLPMDQIVGPSWLETDCFTIVAKMPEGATKDQLPAMFQALLAERFKLAFHKETRLRSGYALVVDRNGSKLRQSEPNSNAADRHAGQVTFGSTLQTAGIKGSITIARLAQFLSNRLDGPVQDLTGMNGTYDIDISWVRDQALGKPAGPFAQDQAAHSGSTDAVASLPAGMGDIFTSLRESLGLRLEPRKQQVEMVVIDHIERIPAEN